MAKYILKEVKTHSDEKAWLHVDRVIYKDYPMWVCPLDSDICNVFNPEHNKKFEHGEAIKTADHIIDLGPEGGDGGGHVVASGTPEEVAQVAESYTGRYLKNYL